MTLADALKGRRRDGHSRWTNPLTGGGLACFSEALPRTAQSKAGAVRTPFNLQVPKYLW